MTARRGVVVLLVVVLSAAGYWLWPSQERRVRARLEALAEAAGAPENETDLARFARARRFRGWLREDVRVEFERAEWPPLEGRDAVAALVARRWAQAAGGLRVELRNLAIAVSADARSADARFTVRVVSLQSNEEPVAVDGRMISVTMARGDGEWLVAAARILRGDDAVR
jgi:hypothetical protein